jgi:hypothetical protein
MYFFVLFLLVIMQNRLVKATSTLLQNLILFLQNLEFPVSKLIQENPLKIPPGSCTVKLFTCVLYNFLQL